MCILKAFNFHVIIEPLHTVDILTTKLNFDNFKDLLKRIEHLLRDSWMN